MVKELKNCLLFYSDIFAYLLVNVFKVYGVRKTKGNRITDYIHAIKLPDVSFPSIHLCNGLLFTAAVSLLDYYTRQ